MRHEQLSVGELSVDNIIGGVNAMVRKIIYLDPTNGSNGNDGKKIDRAVKTLAAAKSLIDTNKNDAIVLVQGTSAMNLATAYDWDLNMCRLIGNGAEHYAGQRARIGQSADTQPLFTVSGYGNLLKNLYFQHGYSTVHVSHSGLLLSGNYNTLENVHISSPLSTGQASDESYGGALRVTGTGFQYFKHCTFGNLSVERTHAKGLIQLGTGTCTLFEDCTFLTRIGDGDPYFLEIENASGLGQAIFKRCMFLSMSTNMATRMAAAVLCTGGTTFMVAFDNECSFAGVTTLAADADMPYLWLPHNFAATADEFNLIALNTQQA